MKSGIWKVLLFVAMIVLVVIGLFCGTKAASGEETQLIRVGEETLNNGVYKIPIELNIPPETVESFQLRIKVNTAMEGVRIDDRKFSFENDILSGKNPAEKVLAWVKSPQSMKDKVEITLSDIGLELKPGVANLTQHPIEVNEKANEKNASELVDEIRELAAVVGTLNNTLNSQIPEQQPPEQRPNVNHIEELEDGDIDEMSVDELRETISELKHLINSKTIEASTRLNAYQQISEKNQRIKEADDVKKPTNVSREVVGLRVKTEAQDRKLAFVREKNKLLKRDRDQRLEEKHLERENENISPRERYVSFSVGAFGTASSSYKEDYYNGYNYQRDYNQEYTSSSGYFTEAKVSTPPIFDGRIAGAGFAGYHFSREESGLYGGFDAKVILAENGPYSCALTAGAIWLDNVKARIGLNIDGYNWTFFVAGIPGAENNVQIGLGYKL